MPSRGDASTGYLYNQALAYVAPRPKCLGLTKTLQNAQRKGTVGARWGCGGRIQERLQSSDEFVALLPEADRRPQRRTANNMNKWNSLSKGGPAAAIMLAGVLVLATGCVGDRVTYVQRTYPVAVQAPEPPPLPLVVTPPPPAVELPPAPVAPMRSAAELDRMLAPVALYPDPLLAQLLRRRRCPRRSFWPTATCVRAGM